jgi:hypothetical protein
MALAPEALGAEFDAALWEFISAVRAGTVKRSRRDHEFASCLAGMWEEVTAQLHVAVQGVTIERGRAKVAELIEAQRALYGSLAAGEGSDL